MKTAQLPLIAELDVELAKDSTSFCATRKFSAPTSLAYSLMLLALLSGPLPLEQLQLMADVHDADALLVTLRQLGLEVPCHQVPEMEDDGHVRCRAVCALSKADTRRVNRWIKNIRAEGFAARASSEHNHLGDYQ
jgi:hypothetical protein